MSKKKLIIISAAGLAVIAATVIILLLTCGKGDIDEIAEEDTRRLNILRLATDMHRQENLTEL